MHTSRGLTHPLQKAFLRISERIGAPEQGSNFSAMILGRFPGFSSLGFPIEQEIATSPYSVRPVRSVGVCLGLRVGGSNLRRGCKLHQSMRRGKAILREPRTEILGSGSRVLRASRASRYVLWAVPEGTLEKEKREPGCEGGGIRVLQAENGE